MSTDLLIDAIERLESAIAEAKETTRECHAARKDLKAAQRDIAEWIKTPEGQPAYSSLLLEAWEVHNKKVMDALKTITSRMNDGDRQRSEALQAAITRHETFLASVAAALDDELPDFDFSAFLEIRA